VIGQFAAKAELPPSAGGDYSERVQLGTPAEWVVGRISAGGWLGGGNAVYRGLLRIVGPTMMYVYMFGG